MSDIFKTKINNQWVGIPSLVGPQGPQGETGPQGPAGVQVNADWTETDTSSKAYILHKPTLVTPSPPDPQTGEVFALGAQFAVEADTARVSRRAAAIDLSGVENADDLKAIEALSGTTGLLRKTSANTWTLDTTSYADSSSLSAVATSGSYNDLSNKPTIPASPVQSNWNESDTSSLAYIQNKPTIPAAQVNSDWNSNSGVSQILNKPSFTTVTISVADWNGGTSVTKSVSGMTSSANIMVGGESSSMSEIIGCQVYCSAQGTGTLTFTCNETPTSAVTFCIYRNL